MKGLVPYTKNFLSKHGSTVLTIAGSIGVIFTAVTASRATIKAIDILNGLPEEDKQSRKEIIKHTWKCYIPTVLVAGTTIGCMISGNVLNIKIKKDLINSYNMLSSYFFAYKDQVKEIYGEEGHNKVIDGIMKHKCKDVYIYTQGILSVDSIYFETADPEKTRTFYDTYSQRYFESTIARVLEAEYHLNRNYILGGEMCVNDFYDYLGLEKIDGGDLIGWDIDEDLYWIDFSHSTTVLDDGMEIFVIDFVFSPEAFEY